MKVDAFDFELPPSCIATRPVTPRDAARLLVVGDVLEDATIRDLPEFLRAGDVMVFNNTKVIPARLFGKRGDAKVEVTLHKRLEALSSKEVWQAFAKPAKRLRVGDAFVIADDFQAIVREKLETGEVVLEFNAGGEALLHKLHQHGAMPLPPYMHREADATDEERYQTVFASEAGAVAAPTAGLHFTDNLLQAIDAKGVKRVEVTLHVGAGTFLPVKVDDTQDHQMHAEEITLSAEAANAINTARENGGRVVAVGTTALRLLESIADEQGNLHAFHGDTSIFITPGYRFRVVDVLMTNFHLPKSTLFMLVSAFCGLERMQQAYAHAIAQGYRFYSYGDGSLLLRNDER